MKIITKEINFLVEKSDKFTTRKVSYFEYNGKFWFVINNNDLYLNSLAMDELKDAYDQLQSGRGGVESNLVGMSQDETFTKGSMPLMVAMKGLGA